MIRIDIKPTSEGTEREGYPIIISNDCLNKFAALIDISKATKVAVVSERVLEENALPELLKGLPRATQLKIMEGGEQCKTFETVQDLWRFFAESGLDRKSLVIILGGGALGDVAGFAASTYMRGIPYAHVPTTLLAQVDASIGGKVGINFNQTKNLVGTFSQPVAVIIDTTTLNSLPGREFLSGFAEVLKHGLIANPTYFRFVVGLKPSRIPSAQLFEVIQRSCEIKQAVVEKDEKESGLRKILNFGHTIGHAIETLSHMANKPLLHGEAVSVGMSAEGKLSQLLGYLTRDEMQEIDKALDAFSLPRKVSFNVTVADVVHHIGLDKKNFGGRVKWSTLRGIGTGAYDIEAELPQVEEAIRYVLE